MFTEDFILRMIRLAVAALARIVGLKSAGLYQEALVEIDNTLEQLTGMRSNLINSLDEPGLLAALSRNGKLDAERTVIVADLIQVEADIYAIQNYQAKSSLRVLRALNLYLEAALEDSGQFLEQLQPKIESNLERLEPMSLPIETLFSLISYSIQRSDYRQAEQAYLLLLSKPDYKQEFQAEARSFYEELLEKSDETLDQAGYQRVELEEKLANLGA